MDTRILVTGGLGYLGSILCEHLLDAGYRVRAVDNLMYGAGQQGLFHLCATPASTSSRATCATRTLMRRLLRDADVVVHLAAIVGAAACDRDPALATGVNLESVRLLYRLRSPQPAGHLPQHQQRLRRHLRREPTAPRTARCGRSRSTAGPRSRRSACCWNSRTPIALRLATVFGMSPRMRLDLLVNHFVYAAFKEGYLVIFEKDFKRNFIHIRDVADCMLHCIAHADRMRGGPTTSAWTPPTSRRKSWR